MFFSDMAARWYNAKSNYQKSMKPKPGNSMEGIHAIIKLNENSLSHRHVFCTSTYHRVLKKCYHCYHPYYWNHHEQGVLQGGGSTFFYAEKRAAAITFFRSFRMLILSGCLSGAGGCACWQVSLPRSSVWTRTRTRSFNRFRQVETLVPSGWNFSSVGL